MVLLAVLVWGPSLAAGSTMQGGTTQGDYYLAPNGNDHWSGRLPTPKADKTDGPFATPRRARDAMRAAGKSGGTVLLREGVYWLDDTFTLGPEDSGRAEHPTVYAAYGDERPVLEGGIRIKGLWKPTGDGHTFSVPMPKGTWVRDLFVDGRQLPCAAIPAVGSMSAHDVEGSKTVFGYDQGDVEPWPDVDCAVVVIRPYEWAECHSAITAIDPKARTVTLAEAYEFPLVPKETRPYSPYRVENVRAAIRRPGQWCHDYKRGVLYFWPPEGCDLKRAEIVGGHLSVMVSVQGNVGAGQWAEHIVLRGLTFRHAGRYSGTAHFGGTALRFTSNARDCAVEDCLFTDVGGSGVTLWKQCQRIRVDCNEFVGTGDSAIEMTDTYNQGPSLSTDHQIVNNYIHHCSTIHKGDAGIHILAVQNSRIAHNLICDLPQLGIHYDGVRFVYWQPDFEKSLKPPYTADAIRPFVRSQGNVFEFNHIHHVMQDFYDGGAIHSWGTMGVKPNIIRNNLIHDIGRGRRTCVGIYLDDESSDFQVRDNVVYGANFGFHLHGCPRDTLENNFILYSGAVDVSIQPEKYNVFPMDTKLHHNIFAWGRGTLFATYDNWNHFFDRRPIKEMDDNLYWRPGQRVSLGQGRMAGFDAHSVIADPAFARMAGDMVLRPGAAAQKLGIHPVDLSRVGPERWPSWIKNPPLVQPLHFPLTPEETAALPGWSPASSTGGTARSRSR